MRKKYPMLAAAALFADLVSLPKSYPMPRKPVQSCNLTESEVAERDRPVSRQERRQMERLAAKGRLKGAKL